MEYDCTASSKESVAWAKFVIYYKVQIKFMFQAYILGIYRSAEYEEKFINKFWLLQQVKN